MKVLIIGLGSIASKHVKALRLLDPAVKVTALRSNREAEKVDGIKDVYSISEIGQAPAFVIISNPTCFHKEAILEALELSCPLFIEKPVLDDPASADAILPLLRHKKVTTYVACNLRFHPVIQFLKGYIGNGLRITEVNVYCGSDLSKWRPTQDYRQSYSARADRGGGVHLDLVHEIDYCWWLFGKPLKSVGLKRKVSDLEIDSADFASFHLMYEAFTANITLNYYRPHPKRSIEIVTSDSVIEADLLKNRVVENGITIFENPQFKMEDTYVEQLRYFLAHLENGTMNQFEEGLEVLKIATTQCVSTTR